MLGVGEGRSAFQTMNSCTHSTVAPCYPMGYEGPRPWIGQRDTSQMKNVSSLNPAQNDFFPNMSCWKRLLGHREICEHALRRQWRGEHSWSATKAAPVHIQSHMVQSLSKAYGHWHTGQNTSAWRMWGSVSSWAIGRGILGPRSSP